MKYLAKNVYLYLIVNEPSDKFRICKILQNSLSELLKKNVYIVRDKRKMFYVKRV